MSVVCDEEGDQKSYASLYHKLLNYIKLVYILILSQNNQLHFLFGKNTKYSLGSPPMSGIMHNGWTMASTVYVCT